MRSYLVLAAAGALLAGAGGCATEPTPDPLAAPAFASSGGIPDLTVDAKKLSRSWIIRDEEASQCAVVEGGVTPGVHRVLRFTATTPNIGTADVFVGNPLDHVAADDGLFEFATCHDHYHFRQ